jgi:lycopene cyclase domain-containing protein
MTHLGYLAALLASTGAMTVVDHRWRLVLWAEPVRALVVLVVGALLFLGWDLLALHHGFYGRGDSALTTGADVLPRLPVEEVVFVIFFCYLSLVLHRLVYRLLGPAPGRPAAEPQESRGEVRSR